MTGLNDVLRLRFELHIFARIAASVNAFMKLLKTRTVTPSGLHYTAPMHNIISGVGLHSLKDN